MTLKQLKLIIPACVLGLSPAHIVYGDEIPQELTDCRTVASATERLACYDQIVDGQSAIAKPSAETATKETAAVTAAPAAAAATVTTAEQAASVSPEALFGKNEGEVRKSVQEATGTKEIKEIEATISKLGPASGGYVVITLDNGQVWKQVDYSRLRLSDNDRVTIRRASLGSFMLKKVGRNTGMRVKRIS